MADMDLVDATQTSLLKLLRDELVAMCEARGIQVGGTKPQLARALLEWVCLFPTPECTVAVMYTDSSETSRMAVPNPALHPKLPRNRTQKDRAHHLRPTKSFTRSERTNTYQGRQRPSCYETISTPRIPLRRLYPTMNRRRRPRTH